MLAACPVRGADDSLSPMLRGSSLAMPQAPSVAGGRLARGRLAVDRGRLARGGVTPALTVVAGLALVAVVAWHGQDFARALNRALDANWGLVMSGVLLEALSVAGYVVLLHRVVSCASADFRWRESADIALAGAAATRLLPTAGLGGAAVTVWALRARGVRPREVAERLLAFLLLLYSVYIGALIACGAGVAAGVVHVEHGRKLGLVAAVLGAGIAIVILGAALAPASLARALARLEARGGRSASVAVRMQENLPVLRLALRRATGELRRPHPQLLGAAAWWAFDMAVLWAMLDAFGAGLSLPVLVLAYFLGTMFNVVPVPGSLSGGLVAVLIAFGTPAAAAIAAVLAYRAIAVWLPAASGLPSLGRLRTSIPRWRERGARSSRSLRANPA